MRIIKSISEVTYGFVPTDLQSLTSKAAFSFIKESTTNITDRHFKQALINTKPSNINEYSSKIPDITFKDIYGIDNVLQEVKTSVIEPFRSPEKYIKLGISPPKGILVHGPTGVGKTMLCSALAAEAGVNFMLVESTQVRSKIVGESEKAISRLFSQARANAPCILFIDQIDILLPKRGTSHSSENTSDRIVTGFLTDVLVVAATNRIEVMDPAVLRPGRFDEHIYISVPNEAQRRDIINGISSKMPIVLDHQQLNEIVQKTENWSGKKY
ncbi:P-loop containing nucleoside triphosphate hydrolase protein [Mycotypha africana]|uniref:P-loop containing nucleoside triphosphate hydrolase protein n=1 Tax=Mycotypha africana TaxID=64632 RepID=UPI002300E9BB|nr:P-loop containing nucleoside triphosphate hydrolase protein [Mycotypha africana]KAI8975692.1 P-loop containing nucleoside triphosphate hydrolase protein [Mycotypha africana]